MKIRMGFCSMAIFAAVVLLACSLVAAERPNIIVVFIDDMGWSDLSCFGGKKVETENIDRLANEGIRFKNFYVNSPICSPSRVALTTGQYPQRWRITSYLAHRQLNRQRGMAQWLDPAAPVLARELRRSGYSTGHFGKWHMGGQRDVGDAPLISQYGFDRSLTNFEGLGPRVLPLKDRYDGKPAKKHGLGSANLGHGPIRWKDRSEITAEFVKNALEFIDHAQAEEKPFYINLWPDDVHSPFFPPRVLRNSTDGSKRALYYAVLDAMDEQLGKLFDRVRDDEMLRENTLIVVASDNGHEHGAGSSDPLRGAKTWLYEGGIRSPLIVWGPGLVARSAAGTTDDESVLCALDLNVSLYRITGTELPSGASLDGEDVTESLLGREKQGRKAPIFWRRPPDRPGTQTEPNPDLAVRDGKWKLLINFDGSRPQLYDLNADISESRNVASGHPEILERLKHAVFVWNAGLPVAVFREKTKKSRRDIRVTRIGGHSVREILGMLGARMEEGISDAEYRAYGRTFDRGDANRDGRHSREEYVINGRYMTLRARSGIFRAADSDSDGFVSRDEYILNRIITDEAKAIVSAMDRNKDGKVSKVEFVRIAKIPDRELRVMVFVAFDVDKSGAIIVPEYLRVWGAWAREEGLGVKSEPRPERKRDGPPDGGRGRGGPPTVAEVFKRFDKNGDGALDGEEIPGGVKQFILPADKNGDGKITREELELFRDGRGGDSRREERRRLTPDSENAEKTDNP